MFFFQMLLLASDYLFLLFILVTRLINTTNNITISPPCFSILSRDFYPTKIPSCRLKRRLLQKFPIAFAIDINLPTIYILGVISAGNTLQILSVFCIYFQVQTFPSSFYYLFYLKITYQRFILGDAILTKKNCYIFHKTVFNSPHQIKIYLSWDG